MNKVVVLHITVALLNQCINPWKITLTNLHDSDTYIRMFQKSYFTSILPTVIFYILVWDTCQPSLIYVGDLFKGAAGYTEAFRGLGCCPETLWIKTYYQETVKTLFSLFNTARKQTAETNVWNKQQQLLHAVYLGFALPCFN